MLYQAFQEYRQQKTPGVLCLRFLREGVCLLHSMALHDRLFTQHRREVEDRYIEVVVGLDNLFREAKEIPEHDRKWRFSGSRTHLCIYLFTYLFIYPFIYYLFIV